MCLKQKPIYLEWDNDSESNSLLESKHFQKFFGSYVLVCTEFDGFLYTIEKDKCWSKTRICVTLPFTSQLIQAEIDELTVQVLTINGLETYSTGKLFHNKKSLNLHNSISLIELRPFSSARKLLLSYSNLILLANSNATNCWTIYMLSKPDIYTIYHNFESLAKQKFSKSKEALIDLMEEVNHMVERKLHSLRLDKNMQKLASVLLVSNHSQRLLDLFKTSCIALGDLYFLSDDKKKFKLASYYYTKGELDILDIIFRVINIQCDDIKCTEGLIYFLKTSLTINDQTSLNKTVSNTKVAPRLDNKAGTKCGEIIVDLLVKYAPNKFSHIVLLQPALLDYMSPLTFQKYIALEHQTSEDMICLSLYFVKRNNILEARKVLQKITENVYQLLKIHYKILFDVKTVKYNQIITFSDYGNILLNYSNIMDHVKLIEVFRFVIEEIELVDIETFLSMCLAHLSSSIGENIYENSQSLIRAFLEHYLLKAGLSNDIKIGNDTEPSIKTRVLKILIRLYLCELKSVDDLQKIAVTEKEEVDKNEYSENIKKMFYRFRNFSTKKTQIASPSIIFSDRRLTYMNLMPPFEVNLFKMQNTIELQDINPNTILSLIKIESLLSESNIVTEVKSDVAQFIKTNSNFIGLEAIKSCILHKISAIDFLLAECPQAILQYAICHIFCCEEWKLLIKKIQHKYNETNNIIFLLLLHEILVFVSTYFQLQMILDMLDENNFVLHQHEDIKFFNFICMSNDTKHSTKLKQMIEQTGHQLFEAINKNKIA